MSGYSNATKTFSVCDQLPPPSNAGQIVYARSERGGAVAFVALYQAADDRLAWFRIGATPHFEGWEADS